MDACMDTASTRREYQLSIWCLKDPVGALKEVFHRLHRGHEAVRKWDSYILQMLFMDKVTLIYRKGCVINWLV